MECVFTRSATFVGSLHVRRNDRIANGTFALSFQGTLDVLSERKQAIHKATVGEHNHTLDYEQPAAPFLLVDKNTASTRDNRWL
jgi:hypothetical protein